MTNPTQPLDPMTAAACLDLDALAVTAKKLAARLAAGGQPQPHALAGLLSDLPKLRTRLARHAERLAKQTPRPDEGAT